MIKPLIKIQLIISSIIIASTGLFVSCDFHSDNMESLQISGIETERELGITRSEVQGEIRIFRIEMAEKIKENNRSIAVIKRKMNNRDMSVKVAQEARIIVFQSENRELKRSIDNYSDLSRNNWDSFRKEFKEDIEELGNSFNNFFENSDVAK